MSQYQEPSGGSSSYTCPFCGTLSQVSTHDLYVPNGKGSFTTVGWRATRCGVCREEMIWQQRKESGLPFPMYTRRWPSGLAGPLPNDAMPETVKSIYTEAREVAPISSRAGAALLRLALQTLIFELEPNADGNLNQAIGELVKGGLDERVQKAMDVLRVAGNNAIHPGLIRLDEDPEDVAALFDLVNLVVRDMIERPAAVEAMFDKLPDGAREQIAKRDTPR